MHPRPTVVHFRVCVREQGAVDYDVVSKSVGTHMAANCIAPDLCEKNVASVPTQALDLFVFI